MRRVASRTVASGEMAYTCVPFSESISSAVGTICSFRYGRHANAARHRIGLEMDDAGSLTQLARGTQHCEIIRNAGDWRMPQDREEAAHEIGCGALSAPARDSIVDLLISRSESSLAPTSRLREWGAI